MNKKTKIIKLVRNFPVLRFYLEIPFILIRTHLMSYAYEAQRYDYIVLEIKIHKWQTKFMLYKDKIWITT